MNTIQKYFPTVSEKQVSQFDALQNLYADWNEKINVISRKDMDNFYVHHVLHSLAVAKICTFNDGAKIIDIGTGGGFPGIPLAIYFPDVQFTLIDAIGKKIKVVNAVSESLGLKNVQAFHTRAEDVKTKFDFTISRAVTKLDLLYHYSNLLIKSDSTIKGSFKTHPMAKGMICLKGGDLLEESAVIPKNILEENIANYFEEDFFETKKVLLVQF